MIENFYEQFLNTIQAWKFAKEITLNSGQEWWKKIIKRFRILFFVE